MTKYQGDLKINQISKLWSYRLSNRLTKIAPFEQVYNE